MIGNVLKKYFNKPINININIGDKVRILEFEKELSDCDVLIEAEKNICGHNGTGKGLPGHCWWFFSDYSNFNDYFKYIG